MSEPKFGAGMPPWAESHEEAMERWSAEHVHRREYRGGSLEAEDAHRWICRGCETAIITPVGPSDPNAAELLATVGAARASRRKEQP